MTIDLLLGENEPDDTISNITPNVTDLTTIADKSRGGSVFAVRRIVSELFRCVSEHKNSLLHWLHKDSHTFFGYSREIEPRVQILVLFHELELSKPFRPVHLIRIIRCVKPICPHKKRFYYMISTLKI